MAKDITNSADILDSRDIIERIEELADKETALIDARRELDELEADPGSDPDAIKAAREAITDADDDFDADEREELRVLRALQDEAEGYSEDWRYGATLIRDSYFKDYAQELAEDIGAIDKAATWPARCIDWDEAARELQMDYTSVDFDGVTYWVR
jgi:hypothetical protein